MSNKYCQLILALLFLNTFSISANSTNVIELNSGNILDFDPQIVQINSLYEGKQLEYYDFDAQSYKNAVIVQIFDNFSEIQLILKEIETGKELKVLIDVAK
jgi:hypothetical protein